MKKILIAIMAVAMLVSLVAFTACNNTDGENASVDKEYTLVAPDGAPALAIANMITQIPTAKAVYGINRKVVSSSIISTEAIKSDVDMAIVPANLAAKIFNTSGGYKMLAVVTNGNLFMTSSISCDVTSLQDLKGKLIYSIGRSSVPDMIFKSLLNNAGVEYVVGEESTDGKVTIKYCNDGSEVISQLALAQSKNTLAFGIYGEPAVTNSKKAKGFQEVFDLQSLWADIDGSGQNGYAQAVLIARDKVCEDAEFVTKLIYSLTANENIIMVNPQKAVENIKAIYPQSALQSNMSMEVVGRCNIKTVKTDSVGRAYYENTLRAVMSIDANLIGGKLPSDDFYLA